MTRDEVDRIPFHDFATPYQFVVLHDAIYSHTPEHGDAVLALGP